MKLPVANVIMQEKNVVQLDLVVDAALEAFRGHFPDYPVLPGVVQVDWAVRFASLYLGCEALFAEAIQIKFKNIIRPNIPLRLSLVLNEQKNKLAFTYVSSDAVMSSGQIRIGA